jgi:CRP-like cAMP-binding protein
MTKSSETHPNHLVGSLPQAIQDSLLSKMDLVHLHKQEIIYEQGEPIDYVYFPCSAVISLLTVMEDGSCVEVAMIGNDGFLGLPRYFGMELAFARGIVQVPGESRRMRSSLFEEEIERNVYLTEQIRRYANAMLSQVARSAGCNRLHTAEQRCARWLSMAHDRAHTDEFPLTQETVAEMLGITRPSAGLVLQSLEKQAVIRATRGKITVLDSGKLKSISCECYRPVEDPTDSSQ